MGAFGLYLGYKLPRFRPRRKSEAVQTLFSRFPLE